MKILFNCNAICLRGTTVAVYDYAKYNEEILGNESVITYDVNSLYNRQLAIEKFQKRFQIVGFDKIGELDDIVTQNSIDFCYMIRDGHRNYVPRNCRTGIHTVFPIHEPHGDVYAYIAKWLSDKMSGGSCPYVPHILTLPKTPTEDLRERYNIPKGAIVFGGHGGEDTFNLSMTHRAVWSTVNQNKNVYFLLMNRNRFCPEHPQIIHIPATANLQEKANFICACDAMIHARDNGESFPLSIGEFLVFGKPIVSWPGGDPGHLHMIGENKWWYNSYEECFAHLNNENILRDTSMIGLVDQYSPENVMQQFKEVFLG